LKDGKDGPSVLTFTLKSFTHGVPFVLGIPASRLLIKLPKLLFTDSGCLRVVRAGHIHLVYCPSVPDYSDPGSRTVSLGLPGLAVCSPNTCPIQLRGGSDAWWSGIWALTRLLGFQCWRHHEQVLHHWENLLISVPHLRTSVSSSIKWG